MCVLLGDWSLSERPWAQGDAVAGTHYDPIHCILHHKTRYLHTQYININTNAYSENDSHLYAKPFQNSWLNKNINTDNAADSISFPLIEQMIFSSSESTTVESDTSCRQIYF